MQALLSADASISAPAWSDFFANFVDNVKTVPPDQTLSLLSSLKGWNGAGSGVGSLSRIIFDVAKEQVLLNSFDEYKAIFVAALALYWRHDEIPILTGDSKSAAFAILRALTDLPDTTGTPPPEDKDPLLPWELECFDLPSHLKIVWDKVSDGVDSADRGRILKGFPFWSEIPRDGPVNNHKKDGDHPLDAKHRSWETETCNILRLLAYLDFSMSLPEEQEDVQSPQEVLLKTFALVADLRARIQAHRKSRSIPESIPRKNPLFSKEDLSVAQATSKINSWRSRGSKGGSKGSGKGSFTSGWGSGSWGGGSSFPRTPFKPWSATNSGSSGSFAGKGRGKGGSGHGGK
jgi:uncharacterized membrane protein YgcG